MQTFQKKRKEKEKRKTNKRKKKTEKRKEKKRTTYIETESVIKKMKFCR